MAVLTLAYFCAKNKKRFHIDEDIIYQVALETANSTEKDQILPNIEQMINSLLD